MRVTIALCLALGLWGAASANAQVRATATDRAPRGNQLHQERGTVPSPAQETTREWEESRGREHDRPDGGDGSGERRDDRSHRSTGDRDARLLPTMTRGVREQVRWFGRSDVVSRSSAPGRSGGPERITWLDRAGCVVQVWQDDNHDGRADRVTVYENGRVVRVLGR